MLVIWTAAATFIALVMGSVIGTYQERYGWHPSLWVLILVACVPFAISFGEWWWLHV